MKFQLNTNYQILNPNLKNIEFQNNSIISSNEVISLKSFIISDLLKNNYFNDNKYTISLKDFLFIVKLHVASNDILNTSIKDENIIDVNHEDVEKFKIENKLQEDNLIIGHIGTFKESKNQKFLLKIVKVLKERNKDVKLLLVGDGSMRDELETMCKDFDISDKVIFTGTRDDIDVILNSMDVFVFPSTFEGLGLVLLEAQAAGLPCVVSEAIQPEADLQLGLFSKLNLSDGAEVWANKIIEVSDKKETNKQKILDAFDNQGYSTEKCISKLLSIYKID